MHDFAGRSGRRNFPAMRSTQAVPFLNRYYENPSASTEVLTQPAVQRPVVQRTSFSVTDAMRRFSNDTEFMGALRGWMRHHAGYASQSAATHLSNIGQFGSWLLTAAVQPGETLEQMAGRYLEQRNRATGRNSTYTVVRRSIFANLFPFMNAYLDNAIVTTAPQPPAHDDGDETGQG